MKNVKSIIVLGGGSAGWMTASTLIKEYPDNKLSSNAYYWLGETFYVRKNYQLAAYNFAAGYKKFPEGSKAADQLLKLGISLFSLEKLTEACATFKKLLEEFPKIPPRYAHTTHFCWFCTHVLPEDCAQFEWYLIGRSRCRCNARRRECCEFRPKTWLLPKFVYVWRRGTLYG